MFLAIYLLILTLVDVISSDTCGICDFDFWYCPAGPNACSSNNIVESYCTEQTWDCNYTYCFVGAPGANYITLNMSFNGPVYAGKDGTIDNVGTSIVNIRHGGVYK